jgi:hypothetical protein
MSTAVDDFPVFSVSYSPRRYRFLDLGKVDIDKDSTGFVVAVRVTASAICILPFNVSGGSFLASVRAIRRRMR